MKITHTLGRQDKMPQGLAYRASLIAASSTVILLGSALSTSAQEEVQSSPAGDQVITRKLMPTSGVQNAREIMRERTAEGPDTIEKKSAGISSSPSWINEFVEVELFTGLYEFDDGPEDDLKKNKANEDTAITNRLHFEKYHYKEEDFEDRGVDGFFGFWASIPIGDDPSEVKAEAEESKSLLSSLFGRTSFNRPGQGEKRKIKSLSRNILFGAKNQSRSFSIASFVGRIVMKSRKLGLKSRSLKRRDSLMVSSVAVNCGLRSEGRRESHRPKKIEPCQDFARVGEWQRSLE